jgi:WD40 repeat protein
MPSQPARQVDNYFRPQRSLGVPVKYSNSIFMRSGIRPHEELLTIRGHKSHVYDVALSPDGERVLSAAGRHTEPPSPGDVKVWDSTNGQEIFSLNGHTDRCYRVTFSADGKRIATASADWTVRVWDAANGEELLTLKGHTDQVQCVAFSPDGKQIASAGSDRTIKVWDAATGQETITLKGHASPIMSVSYSPDGKRIVSTGGDGMTKVWDARPLEGGATAPKNVSVPTGSPRFQDLNTTDYQRAFKQAEAEHMRPSNLVTSVRHGTILYSGFFMPNEPPELKWSSRHEMSSQAFDQTHAELTATPPVRTPPDRFHNRKKIRSWTVRQTDST